MEEEGEPGEEGERMREKELSLQRKKNESEKKASLTEESVELNRE